MYAAGDVRVETVHDPRLLQPTDAIVRVTHACICGSDLWPYQKMEPTPNGRRMGHEFIGVVEDVGNEVRTVKRGDLVVAPFAWSDGTCEFCQHGLQTSCLHGGFWGGDLDGGQGEAVRVPFADGTLVRLPVRRDDALMPSLLTLTDVIGDGAPRRTRREGRAGKDRRGRRRRRGPGSAESSRTGGSAPSGSSCSVAMRIASPSRTHSVRPTS